MVVTLGGRRYQIRYVTRLGPRNEHDGDCAREAPLVIRIRKGQEPKDWLDTHIHEALHAIFPFLDEEAVTQGAHDLTALLFDTLEYRIGG